MTECEHLIWPSLNSAFEEAVNITQRGDECQVTVPFERADQDAITLWVSNQDGRYTISDEGETYGMLYLSNISLDQERRQKRLKSTKQRFNLEEAKYEIRLTASDETLGDRILDAIQAVQSISYLIYTRRPYTQSTFQEDVGDYLTQHGYQYSRNATVEGMTDRHRVDFDITADQPTYIETLYARDVSTAHSIAQRTAYKWIDIERAIPNAHRVSVVNDESGESDDRTVGILNEYSDACVLWSGRGRLTEVLGPTRGAV